MEEVIVFVLVEIVDLVKYVVSGVNYNLVIICEYFSLILVIDELWYVDEFFFFFNLILVGFF